MLETIKDLTNSFVCKMFPTVWGWIADALWLLWLGKGGLQTFLCVFKKKENNLPFTSTIKCIAGGANQLMESPTQTQVDSGCVAWCCQRAENKVGWWFAPCCSKKCNYLSLLMKLLPHCSTWLNSPVMTWKAGFSQLCVGRSLRLTIVRGFDRGTRNV